MGEEYLNGLLLPNLIEVVLEDVLREKPYEPRQVIEVLQRALVNNSKQYYTSVEERFKSFLQDTPRVGFRTKDVFFFVTLRSDGTAEELFPGGRHVRVTPQTFEAFSQLCSARAANSTLRARMLPLNPKMHLMSNYLPIAEFILGHVVAENATAPQQPRRLPSNTGVTNAVISIPGGTENSARQWAMSREEWDRQQITFCVPYKNVLHDLRPNGRQTLVPYEQMQEFSSAACAFLRHKKGGEAADNIPLSAPQNMTASAVKPQPLHPPSPPTKAQPPKQLPQQLGAVRRPEDREIAVTAARDVMAAVDSAPTSSLHSKKQAAASVLLAPQQPAESLRVKTVSSPSGFGARGKKVALAHASTTITAPSFSLSSSILLLYEEYPEYLSALQFANTELGAPLTREEFDELDVFYVVPVGGKLLPLIDDGEAVKVKFKNKDWFVHLAQRKLGLSDSRATSTTPTRRSPSGDAARHALEAGHSNEDIVDLAVLNAKLLASSPQLGGLFSPSRYKFSLFPSREAQSKQLMNNPLSPADDQTTTDTGNQLTDVQQTLHLYYLLRQLQSATLLPVDYAILGLTFAIEHRGTRVELIPGGANIPVTGETVRTFVRLAQDVLWSGRTPASSSSGTEGHLESKDHDHDQDQGRPQPLDVTTLPSSQSNDSDQYTASNSPSAWAAAQGFQGQMAEEMESRAEREFWTGIVDHLSMHPESASCAHFSFAVFLPDSTFLLLKEGGDRLRLTPENAHEFVKLTRERRAHIHEAFVNAENNVRNQQRQHFLRMQQQQQLQQQQLLTQAPLLSAEDLNSTFFALFDRLNSMDLSPRDVEDLNLTYAIPRVNGTKLDLIPNGRHIRVDASKLSDFINRVVAVRNQAIALSFPASMDFSDGEDDEEIASCNSQQRLPLVRQVSRMSRLSGASGQSMSITRSICTIPLTPEDIQNLEEYEMNLIFLRETDVDKETFDSWKMTYCIRCKQVTFNLINDGQSVRVLYEDRVQYIDLALRKITELKRNQRDRDCVVLPAVPEEAMALFSPNHFTQDLFAPAQQMTLR